MAKCIYIGNLPRDLSEEDLQALLSSKGTGIELVTLCLDKKTKRSRGFAFVDMADEEQTAAMIAALKGHAIGDRELKVNSAHRDKREAVKKLDYEPDYRDSRPRRRRK